jgi:hypothetical protein
MVGQRLSKNMRAGELNCDINICKASNNPFLTSLHATINVILRGEFASLLDLIISLAGYNTETTEIVSGSNVTLAEMGEVTYDTDVVNNSISYSSALSQ